MSLEVVRNAEDQFNGSKGILQYSINRRPEMMQSSPPPGGGFRFRTRFRFRTHCEVCWSVLHTLPCFS